MAIQEATEAQKKLAESNADACAQSLQQQAEQEAAKQMMEAKEALDKMQQQLAKLPEIAVGNLMKVIDMLLNIISGCVDNVSEMFDPAKIIAKIEQLLKPVISTLTSLPIPEIPGLKQIAQLLAALKALIASMLEGGDGSSPSISAEIPPVLMSMLKNLLSAIQSLCTVLPLVLINLIFQMLNCIVRMFQKIASIIGVPSIPFPLNIVPKCITLLPDIMAFMLQAPTQIVNVVEGVLKKAYGKITSMQFPQMPDSTGKPKFLPSCPQRDKKEEPAKDNNTWNEALQEAGIDPNAAASEDQPESEIEYSFGSIL